jgi:hypothetical protein
VKIEGFRINNIVIFTLFLLEARDGDWLLVRIFTMALLLCNMLEKSLVLILVLEGKGYLRIGTVVVLIL